MAKAEIVLMQPSHSRNISGNSNTVQNISSDFGGQKINKNMIIQNQKINSRTFININNEGQSSMGGDPSPSYVMALQNSQKSINSIANTDNMNKNRSNTKFSQKTPYSPDDAATVLTQTMQQQPHPADGSLGSNYSQTTLNNNQTVKINNEYIDSSISNHTGQTTKMMQIKGQYGRQPIENSPSGSYISQENTFTIKQSEANAAEKTLMKKLENQMRENDNLMNLIKEGDSQLARKSQECENMQSIMQEYIQPMLIKLLTNQGTNNTIDKSEW